MGLLAFRLKHNIVQAQQGNQSSRDWILRKHHSFVAKTCSRICKRYLTWENDDELSIGIIALNEAIDAYDTDSSIKFTSFAYTVINRRLIDYFRSQEKYQDEQLAVAYEGENELDAIDNNKSLSKYEETKAIDNLAYLIEQYKTELCYYNIDINELEKISPKHQDTREALQKAALALTKEPELVHYLKQYGQLPIKKLCQYTGLSRKVLEKRRKYIIALVLILIEPQLAPIKQFSRFPMVGGE